jgi:hypothetical protein
MPSTVVVKRSTSDRVAPHDVNPENPWFENAAP